MDSDIPEDIDGDYDSVEGIRDRALDLGNPTVAAFVERAEDRVFYDEDAKGYLIDPPDGDDAPDAEMLFHLGILTGAALERKYPAGNRGDGE